ncbi:MAG: ferrous iron transport protein B [Clostridia bacterium]|nr:ferrous iron transport protein B [Clostridia bacterium]
MGLTHSSVGKNAISSSLSIKKQSENDLVIALAGNPNVGKSTLFNNLTGMNQHTGNWPGKTVTNAQGYCKKDGQNFVFVDIPGTYSLMAHSAEEEVARNFICFGNPDAVIVVCDATCLERNINLVLQIIEISKRVIVCVNLLDEARRKKIKINLPLLEKRLGVKVIGITARKKKSTDIVLDSIIKSQKSNPYKVRYCEEIESAINTICEALHKVTDDTALCRWLSLRLLSPDESLIYEIDANFGKDFLHGEIENVIKSAKTKLEKAGYDCEKIKDEIVTRIVESAEEICKDCVVTEKKDYSKSDRTADKILTSRTFGYPTMLLFLALIFFITIVGANYPSTLLSNFLFGLEDTLYRWLDAIGLPNGISRAATEGMYRVLAWVTAVMLPPMAIFFPLFTLLEDVGYLPRIAYNLDKPFRKCKACGKQALTMCMGFGCNAAGVVGCRIIDSPRERLLAILTNSFVPCNGRFPAIISIITMFFIGVAGGIFSSVFSAVILTLFITFSIIMTLVVTKILSSTLLKGVPSSFTLEMPSYRKPQIVKIIIRSIFDRTLFVLSRAVSVAAPAGIIIWCMANITYDDTSLLNICANFLEPFGKLMGLDGIILIAFILGFPANEIVVPIIIMAYTAQSSLTNFESTSVLRELLTQNGWTAVTALCFIVFSLMHWPCSTTLLTIKKETGSLKWTALAAAIPTVCGVLCCILINLISKIFI